MNEKEGETTIADKPDSLLSNLPSVITPIALSSWFHKIADGTWSWVRNTQCKYVNMQIDTRRGAYAVYDRDRHPLTEEQLFHQYSSRPAKVGIDPDLLLARDVASKLPTMHGMAAYGIQRGIMDDAPEVMAAFAAIKRVKKGSPL